MLAGWRIRNVLSVLTLTVYNYAFQGLGERMKHCSNRLNLGHPQMQHQCVQPGGCKSIFQVTQPSLCDSGRFVSSNGSSISFRTLPASSTSHRSHHKLLLCFFSPMCFKHKNKWTNEDLSFPCPSTPQILLKNMCRYEVNMRQKLRTVRNAFWKGVSVGVSTEPWILGMGEDPLETVTHRLCVRAAQKEQGHWQAGHAGSAAPLQVCRHQFRPPMPRRV